VIAAAQRLGLTVILTDDRFSGEIDLRPPLPVDADLFDSVVQRLVCMCQPRNLTRAISNLIDHASRVSQEIELVLGEDDGSIFIDVRDDGPGLSDDLKTQVFEPFFKADTARAASSGGLGLGLSIARSIAYAQGGRLDLMDRAPRGLVARLTLPKAGAPDGAACG